MAFEAPPLARLLRWLGPWADPHLAPRRLLRRELTVHRDGRHFPAWLYVPRRIEGALLVVPGLHFLGPADPRLDRFCRVLANAGIQVLCPFLPDHTRLLVGEGAGPDSCAAFDLLVEHTPRTFSPGVFSISFGSRPALEVAARREVGALMTFGGFADWTESVAFSLQGAEGRPHDPLNRPVVFLHLLPYFPGFDEQGRERLARAMMRQMRATWGRVDLKVTGAARAITMKNAESLEGEERHLFLQSTGYASGGDERALAQLEACREAFAFLAPGPWAEQVAAGVPLRTVAHGREDDVIPVEHSERLAAMLHSKALVTGAYEHAGRGGASAFFAEAAVSIEMLRAMARTGCIHRARGSY